MRLSEGGVNDEDECDAYSVDQGRGSPSCFCPAGLPDQRFAGGWRARLRRADHHRRVPAGAVGHRHDHRCGRVHRLPHRCLPVRRFPVRPRGRLGPVWEDEGGGGGPARPGLCPGRLPAQAAPARSPGKGSGSGRSAAGAATRRAGGGRHQAAGRTADPDRRRDPQGCRQPAVALRPVYRPERQDRQHRGKDRRLRCCRPGQRHRRRDRRLGQAPGCCPGNGSQP